MKATRAADGKANLPIENIKSTFKHCLEKAQNFGIATEDLGKPEVVSKESRLLESISNDNFIALKGAHYAKNIWGLMSTEEYFDILRNTGDDVKENLMNVLMGKDEMLYRAQLHSVFKMKSIVHNFEYVNERFTLAGQPELVLNMDAYLTARECCTSECSPEESVACYVAQYLKRREEAMDIESLYIAALKIPFMRMMQFFINGDKKGNALSSAVKQQMCTFVKVVLDCDLIDPNRSYEILKSYIKAAIKDFHPKKEGFNWYACYLAIVQSSGWGKTRLCLELRKDFYMFYICLRDSSSSGDPPRSQIANLIDKLRTMGEFLLLICAVYQVFLDHIESKSSYLNGGWETFSWYVFENSSTRDHKFWSAVEEKYQDKGFWNQIKSSSSMVSTTDSAMNIRENTPPADIHKISNHILWIWDKIRDKLNGTKKSYDNEKEHEGKETISLLSDFVFVLDEASALLRDTSDPNSATAGKMRFYEWRRAISYLKVPVCFVLIDTSSKISNFAPPTHLDHSSRVVQGARLFMPLYALSVRGVLTPPEKASKYWIDCTSGKNLDSRYKTLRFYPAELAERCRPLIQKYFETSVQSEATVMHALTQTMTFAKTKMMSDKKIDFLSILCCRWAVRPLVLATAEELTAKNMATCVYLSKERDIMHIEYVPEPVMAEVAARITEEDKDFETCVMTLHESLQTGELSAISSRGDKGELVASIVFTRLMDQAVIACHEKGGYYSFSIDRPAVADDEKAKYYSFPLNLGIVLGGLNEILQKELTSIKLLPYLAGYVAFTKWTKIYVPPSRKALLEAWKDRCALICMDGQHLFDLIIPTVVREKLEEGSGEQVFEAAEEHMSGIFIQVKNLSSPWHAKKRNEYITKMDSWFTENISAIQLHTNILIQVGNGGIGTKESGHIEVMTNASSLSITIPSIESLIFLPEKIRDLLQRISSITKMEEAFTNSYEGILPDQVHERLVPYYQSFVSNWRAVDYSVPKPEQNMNPEEERPATKKVKTSAVKIPSKRKPSRT